MRDVERFPRGWTNDAIGTFVCGSAMLILLTVTACKNAPVAPGRAIDNSRQGQEVFLKYGLMDIGTIWGHCAYLGHDFGATTFHDWPLPPG